MKTIEVTRLSHRPLSASDVPAAMEADGICYNYISNVNWPDEYPYAPDIMFRIAHTGNAIIINYKVRELSVRAVEGTDNGSVWEDSCVEFFLRQKGSPEYFNIECNCIGTLLVASGPDRNHRTHLPADMLCSVKRYSTLGNNTFEEKSAPSEWEMSLIIPTDILGIESLRGLEMEGNFYKCGDLLDTPHFLSWNHIDSPVPDFHRPEFFGRIIFKS